MFAHEFMRNAILAGSFIALACGLIGYFVVLRPSKTDAADVEIPIGISREQQDL